MRRILLLGLGLLAYRSEAWTLLGSSLQGWQTKRLTIYFSAANCPLPAATMYSVVDQAIRTWNGVATSSLSLERSAADTTVTVADFIAGTASQAPVILCDTNFSADNSSADPDTIPAATRLGSGSPITYGGTLLNAQAGGAAEISNLSNDQLALTIAHEIGHILGLGHSSLVNALMYYSIANKASAYLDQDDRDAISYLYPRNEFAGGSLGCGAVHRAERTSPTWGIWLVVFLGIGASFVTRRLALRSAQI